MAANAAAPLNCPVDKLSRATGPGGYIEIKMENVCEMLVSIPREVGRSRKRKI